MSRFKSFDFYPKLSDEFRIRTFHGGLLSIISIITIIILFINELSHYLTIDVNDMLYVDISRNEQLSINFDVTFQRIPCVLLSLDAMDQSGNHQISVNDHHITKQSLDKDGKPIGERIKTELGGTLKKTDLDNNNDKQQDDKIIAQQMALSKISEPGYCGSCYGAAIIPNQCCNTCDSVKDVYRQRGWSLPKLDSIEQCLAIGQTMNEGEQELAEQQGCHVTGYLEVNKVAGNFHFAPGKSYQNNNVHIHDLQAFTNGKFNVSHTIKHISFGVQYPGLVNPLDNTERIIPNNNNDFSAAGMYAYYLKVVPTEYTYLNGTTVQSNQYSVTEHYHTMASRQNTGLPGCFFFYDLSAVMVKYNEQRKSFFHFITQLCAILGGVFTVSQLIDRLLYTGINVVQKRREGKLI